MTFAGNKQNCAFVMVNARLRMSPAEFAFAIMCGVTVSGLLGSAVEIALGRPVSFAEPIGSPLHFLGFALSTVFVGPMMLTNDAIRARREGAISTTYLGFCAFTALVWASALGIAAVTLATGV
jgi:hypothetical protein